MFAFLRGEARWLAGGFLLFFFSAFGQTYFIALSAGEIRRDYGLSHGEFGGLYMAATLASAATLTRLGRIVDGAAARRVVLLVAPMLALAAATMALARHVVLLFGALYLLRLFGQGMMTHSAYAFLGRWFSAGRGRAVSLAAMGMNLGEALFPPLAVALIAAAGWRWTWALAAGTLLAVALPAMTALVAVERAPLGTPAGAAQAPAARGRTRAEALRDPLFYLLVLAAAPPALIGTTIVFHQAHLAELRGWPLEAFAASFPLYAATTVVFALVSGHLVDRFSSLAFMPIYLLPLGAGCLLLSGVASPWIAPVFLILYGVSNGFSMTLFGALWPEVYGAAHLGAIRAIVVAAMVFASALGPGLAGLLIDVDVAFPAQVAAMGVYCLGVSAVMGLTARRRALAAS